MYFEKSPKTTLMRDSQGAVQMTIVFYDRLNKEIIDDEIIKLVKDNIRDYLRTDERVRTQIKAAIETSFMTLPIDVIKSTVKEVVAEELANLKGKGDEHKSK